VEADGAEDLSLRRSYNLQCASNQNSSGDWNSAVLFLQLHNFRKKDRRSAYLRYTRSLFNCKVLIHELLQLSFLIGRPKDRLSYYVSFHVSSFRAPGSMPFAIEHSCSPASLRHTNSSTKCTVLWSSSFSPGWERTQGRCL
jgi:hypothetical protein